MSGPLLQVTGLKKYFKVPNGFLHAVDDVSFSIGSGKTLGVVGESGCGKSTLGRLTLRLIDPTEGHVIFDGKDIIEVKQIREIRKRMQIIFQDPYSSLNPRMNVQRLIAEPMIVNRTYPTRKEIYANTARLMDTVGLAPRLAAAYPHELDGGRRQRIGIARALSLNPKFIVCDEPVSALDVSIQAQILNLLMDLQRDMGLTYMFISHDLSVVKHISDEILVMYLGQCIEKADSDELFKNPLHPYTKALLAAVPKPEIESGESPQAFIKGEVTNPINPVPGCRFAPRCPHCTDKCLKGDINLTDIGNNHFVACVLAGSYVQEKDDKI